MDYFDFDCDIDYNEPMKNRDSLQEQLERGFYIAGWCAIGVSLGLLAVIRITGINPADYIPPCAFHRITGLYCPGCGGTRATIAFLTGHWIRAFMCHPFVPYVGILCGWFMITQTLERICKKRFFFTVRYHDAYLWIAVAILCGNFLIRNVLYIATGITCL